eukprot:PITA_15258
MSTRALSGGKYFVTFIDDHCRKTWIYFLKTKDEVFDQFREFKALVENMTGKKIKEVVPRLEDRLVVGSRWIYKIKYAANGSIKKYMARFVAKGYAQKEGIDYEETFAPVTRYTSIRSVISLPAQMGWEIHQMDVKTKFLNRVIQEEVYIEQPKGFETHEKRTHVCRLKKALYGLKQAPRA